MEHHLETFHQLEQKQVRNKLPLHSRQLHYISAKIKMPFNYAASKKVMTPPTQGKKKTPLRKPDTIFQLFSQEIALIHSNKKSVAFLANRLAG